MRPAAAIEKHAYTNHIENGVRVTDPKLPDEPGTVHALDRDTRSDRMRDRVINGITYTRYQGQLSMCGKHVQVVLPTLFDSEDPDACPRCAAILAPADDPVGASVR
ncbi:MAG: hypothetical protein WC054_02675 [Candidatus Nanopelagicales bacterium]